MDRQNAIKITEEIEKKRKEEQLIGAAQLMEQIDENEQERLFELERKDQEKKRKKEQDDAQKPTKNGKLILLGGGVNFV